MPTNAKADERETTRTLLYEVPNAVQDKPKLYQQADKSIYKFEIPAVDVAKLAASSAQTSAKKLAKVKDDFSLSNEKAAAPMITKKEAVKQRNTKQLTKYLNNLNESQIQEDSKADLQKSTIFNEAPATRRERA